MKRKLNFKFLLGLGLSLIVVAFGVNYLHRVQAAKQVEFFLVQAKQSREKGQTQREITFLNRYLLFRPNDVPSRVRLGDLLVETARNPDGRLQAFLFLNQTLRRDASLHDVRRQVVELAMHPSLRSYDEALKHIELLIPEFPKDGKLRFDQAICHLGQRDFVQAEKSLAVTIEIKPEYVEAYLLQAQLLKQRNEIKLAEDLMEMLVKRNSSLPSAYLASATFWNQLDQPKKAELAIQQARMIAPDELEVIFAVANLAEQQATELSRDKQGQKLAEAKWEESNKEYRRGLALHSDISPDDAASKVQKTIMRRAQITAIYRALTGLEIRASRYPEAEKLLETARQKLPEQIVLRFAEIDLLILAKKFHEAEEKLQKVRSEEVINPELDYHQARIEASKGNWVAVTATLKKALIDLSENSTLYRQISYLEGEAWQRLFQYDRAATAFRRAIASDPRDPLWLRATVALADSLTELGQNGDAIEVYEKGAIRSTQLFIPVARLKMFEMLRKPEKDRSWNEVEEYLNRAPEGLDVEILRSDLLVLRGQKQQASKKLDEVRTKYPESSLPWVALALLENGGATPEKANQILEEAKLKLGDRLDFRLARIRLLTKNALSDQAIRDLIADVRKLPTDERFRLLQTAAQKASEFDSKSLAKEIWTRIGEEFPNHLGVLLTRFEIAMSEASPTEIEALLNSIRTVDGAEGTLAQACNAIYLIWKDQRKEPADLDEALRLLSSVEKKRPSWSRIQAHLGIVSELRKRPEEAIKYYQRAVDLGDRDPTMVRRLVEMYFERQRIVEVDKILNSIPSVSEMASLQQIVAEVSVATRNFERALNSAGKAVSRDTDKPEDLLWLARMDYLAGRRDEAEDLLRKATKIAPQLPDTWVTLVQFLVNQKRVEEAIKTIDLAKQSLDPTKHALVFAQCYELVTRLKEAGEIYEKLLKAAPEDLALARAAASFYLRERNMEPCTALLEKILNAKHRTPEDEKFASRLLAMILAASPDYEKSRRALTILDLLDPTKLGDPSQGLSLEDLRARAVALSLQRDRKSRLAAIKLLEEVDRTKPLAPEDSFLLAQLHFRFGDWNTARFRLRQLTKAQPDNLYYVGYFAEALLKKNSPDEAQPLVATLLKAQPESPFSVTLGIRLDVAQNRNAKALAAAKKWIGAEPERSLPMASVFEELNARSEAESLYRDFAREVKLPQASLPLAAFLGKTNRLAEALSILEKALGKVTTAEAGGIAVESLYLNLDRSAEAITKVRTWINAALLKEPRSLSLLHQLAAIQNLTGEYDLSAKMYQKILEIEPKNVLAYNNLAVLIALRDKQPGEALRLIQQAKKLVGPLPDLLDTEGIILVLTGDLGKAVESLLDANSDNPSAAGCFHLAQAYMAQNRKDDAMLALREGKKLGLKISDLHPLEKAAYSDLIGKFPELQLP